VSGDQTQTAIIDIGSTSIRMLVGGEFHHDIARLGEGLSVGGVITPDALGRAESAFAQFAAIASARGSTRTVAVATAAARRAQNTDVLFDIAEQAFGSRPTLLSGDDEGRLAFAGATAGRTGRVMVVDIGGASTEFAAGTTDGGLDAVYSADIGAASVTDQFFITDPPAPAELSAALSVAELHLVDAQREIPHFASYTQPGQVVGIGGTITTMAAVEIGLDPFDPAQIEGFSLTIEAAEDVFRTLATETEADRAFNPGLGKDRAAMIVGGSCVLIETMRQLGLGEIVVSTAGLIEGVAQSLARGEWDA
jgi:exopolyphosphatase/guanosine-5'-triphosphate,3'-diphosphate pyrophosphatase